MWLRWKVWAARCVACVAGRRQVQITPPAAPKVQGMALMMALPGRAGDKLLRLCLGAGWMGGGYDYHKRNESRKKNCADQSLKLTIQS